MTLPEETLFKQTWLTNLVNRSGRDLLRFLTARIKDPAAAADLAQEVYLRLLRVEDLSLIREPRAFALRIAANVAYEWRMQARNRWPHSADMLEDLSEEGKHADPSHLAVRAQQIANLRVAFDALTPKCRAVVLLHRRDGLTCQQIADQMGLSLGMVKKYLAKGLLVCRQHLLESAPQTWRDK